MQDIRQYRYHSLIIQTLGPSLDELKQFGYLADWQIEKTNDGENYKVVLRHGEKFHRDRRERQSRKRISNGSPEPMRESDQRPRSLDHKNRDHTSAAHTGLAPAVVRPQFDPVLVAEITRRGINEKKAYELLSNLKPGQENNLVAQLEYADQTVQQLQGTSNPVRNPAGFIISFIANNSMLPDNFETSAQRKTRQERERKEGERRAAKDAREQLEWEYDNYRDKEIDRYIAENAAAFEALKDAKWKEERGQFSFATESMAKLSARF
jgi:hypothetical protein